jgi:phosphoglucomutase
MIKILSLFLIPLAVYAIDIEKIIDKNATETSSYKEFIKKHGVAKYHECRDGILYKISHNPYEDAPKETMMRNIMLNPIKCDSKYK